MFNVRPPFPWLFVPPEGEQRGERAVFEIGQRQIAAHRFNALKHRTQERLVDFCAVDADAFGVPDQMGRLVEPDPPAGRLAEGRVQPPLTVEIGATFEHDLHDVARGHRGHHRRARNAGRLRRDRRRVRVSV